MGKDHDAESLSTERLPAQDKYDTNQTVMDLPVGPAHEALHQNFEEQPETACGLLTPRMDQLSGFVAPLALHLDAFSFFEDRCNLCPSCFCPAEEMTSFG